MKKILLSFGDKSLKKSKQRLLSQAKKLNFYTDIVIYDESNLSHEFIAKFSHILKPGIKGFGYWSWKPQVIKQVLDEMNEGDILHYMDIGCHLNLNGLKRLSEYIDILKNSKGVLGFDFSYPIDNNYFKHDGRELFDWPEKDWTKIDLIKHFKAERDDILNTPQICATTIFFLKNSFSQKFVNDWVNTFKENLNLIDDSLSKNKEKDSFIMHRHDQSIFSILGKLKKISVISSYEIYYPNKNNIIKADWKALNNTPIHAKRDKDKGFYLNNKRRIKYYFNKFILWIKK